MNSTFGALERALSEQKWGAADSETRELICRLPGEPLHVTPEIIDAMGEEDLQRIDELWGGSSQGLFGLRVQANLWIEAGGPAEVYVFKGMSENQGLGCPGFFDAVNLPNVGMIQGGEDFGFSLEAAHPLGIRGKLLG